MFVGRQQELKKLNMMYESGQFEFAVIYGRRRVGKTTLIKEFCKGKKAIYFVAREANDIINIENFSADVFTVTSKESQGNVYFSNWEKAFDYIYKISNDERIVLIIDEYPYLAQSNRSISSIIQAHIDMRLVFGSVRFFYEFYGVSGIRLQKSFIWKTYGTIQNQALYLF